MSSAPSPEPSLALYQPPGRVSGFMADALLGSLRALSSERLTSLSRFVGGFAFTLGIRRRVTLDNLAHALPELSESERWRIAREAYGNMALAALEALVSPSLPHEEILRRVDVSGMASIEAAIAAGKGVCIATGHFGSWELFGEIMARRGLALNVVVRPLKGALNARIVQSRLESGVKLIHPKGAYPKMLEVLERGELMVLLVDQAIPAKKGVFVPFFGRLASTTPALSAAALRTGAPLFVVMGRRDGDRIRMEIDGPIPFDTEGDPQTRVAAHVARVTAALEASIRRAPEQWLWLHRRWKVQPPSPSLQRTTKTGLEE